MTFSILHRAALLLVLAAPIFPSPAFAAEAPKADPAAFALLKTAHDARQVLPDDFPGFTATLTLQAGGKIYPGTVSFEKGKTAEVKFEGVPIDDLDWAVDQVQSTIGHRRGGDFAKGDGRWPLTFGTGPDAENSFGRQILLNDMMQSAYRVRDGQVTEVTRTADNLRFTISVIQSQKAGDGKYLPQHFIVSYRDAKSGDLKEVQAFRDAYAQRGAAWLPVSRTVIFFEAKSDTPSMRSIGFGDVKLLAKP